MDPTTLSTRDRDANPPMADTGAGVLLERNMDQQSCHADADTDAVEFSARKATVFILAY